MKGCYLKERTFVKRKEGLHRDRCPQGELAVHSHLRRGRAFSWADACGLFGAEKATEPVCGLPDTGGLRGRTVWVLGSLSLSPPDVFYNFRSRTFLRREFRSAGISDACVGPPRALTFIEVFASPFALTLFTALWR